MSKKTTDYSWWYIRNSHIIFFLEVMLYIFGLILLYSQKISGSFYLDQQTIESYLSFHQVIAVPIIALFGLVHFIRTKIWKNKKSSCFYLKIMPILSGYS